MSEHSGTATPEEGGSPDMTGPERPETVSILYRGSDRSAPYPVSRLARASRGDDLAAEVEQAESMLGARTGAKLRVIADQIEAL
jgi:hypothetical protein